MTIELQHGEFYQLGDMVLRAHFEESAGWWELAGCNTPESFIVTSTGRLYAGWSPTDHTIEEVKELPETAERPKGEWAETHGPYGPIEGPPPGYSAAQWSDVRRFNHGNAGNNTPDQPEAVEVELCPRCGISMQATHYPLCQERDGTPTDLTDELVRRGVAFYEEILRYLEKTEGTKAEAMRAVSLLRDMVNLGVVD